MPAASPNPPVNTDANLTRFSRHFHLTLGKEVSDGKTELSLSATGLLTHLAAKVFSSYEVNRCEAQSGPLLTCCLG